MKAICPQSFVVPSEQVTVAVNVCDPPVFIDKLDGVITIDVGVGSDCPDTFTAIDDVQQNPLTHQDGVLSVTSMIALPPETPVTTPFWSTAATAGFSETQVSPCVTCPIVGVVLIITFELL